MEVSSYYNSSFLLTNYTFMESRKYFWDKYYSNLIFYIAFGSVICLAGLFSNLVCLIAIVTYPPLRKRTNILVANLVIINILLAVSVHPPAFVALLYRQYGLLPKNFCLFNVYYFFITHAFVWQECALAVNRFVAIILPLHYKLINTKSVMLWSVFAGYLISFGINAYPLGARVHSYVSSLPFGGCQYNPEGSNSFAVLHSVLGVYLPMGIMGVSYVVIFGTIVLRKMNGQPGHLVAPPFRAASQVAPPSRAASQVQQARRFRLAVMLFVSVVWFALTYLPHPILTAFFKDIYTADPRSYFYVRWVLQLGVAGNPVIYALLNRDFRAGIAAVLTCKLPRRKVSPPEIQLLAMDHRSTPS
ncbi:hypothetical protein BV898_00523 [Hypsibius exemplaris]|uniref:G-protein coupled receptors family 1 profile domain-containing protein n=1 Tax=Hypsibius exemplaris TaxID=2072580 RepID=A0A1W0XDN2_HYPEX|nr:hypothetical protein BV898_00523 [Hypsibius exemplaris]